MLAVRGFLFFAFSSFILFILNILFISLVLFSPAMKGGPYSVHVIRYQRFRSGVTGLGSEEARTAGHGHDARAAHL